MDKNYLYKIILKDEINNDIIDYINSVFFKANLSAELNELNFVYLSDYNNFILLTDLFIYIVSENNDIFLSVYKIPIDRILNIFVKHKSFTSPAYIAFDCSNKKELVIFCDLPSINNDVLSSMIRLINKHILLFKTNFNLKIIFNHIDFDNELNNIELFDNEIIAKPYKKVISDNKRWFNKTLEEKIKYKSNIFNLYQEQENEKKKKKETSEINYENMSLEELQKLKKEIEKKNLIEELKEMNECNVKKSEYNPDIIEIPIHQKQPKEKSLSKKQRIKENKKHGVAYCPKCGSTSITTTNKKISISKGVVGNTLGAIIGPGGAIVGAVVGGLGSKKMYCVCMNCGHKWKL